MTIFIDVQKVSFYYYSHRALDGVKLKVNQGDFVGIIGPNGSGKSTLLKIISGVLKPQTGVVFLKGSKLTTFPRKEIAKSLAVVPQDSSASFNFKVKDIVMMGRYPHQVKFADDTDYDKNIVNKAMTLTGCHKLEDRFFQELSGGEKQLVVLARALAQEPQILLLDEPTSHLDIGFQTEIFDLIFELNRKTGITIIAVLHDLNLASQYCDYLWLMDKGKIFAAGSPEKVLTENNIKNVYNTRVIMEKHPIHFRPRVTLFSNKNYFPSLSGKKIHVIGGGGSGSSLISFLSQSGAKVSVGVINIGDTDWETARQLNVTLIEENPFSPISTESLKRCAFMMEKADIIVAAEFPVGHGNLGNLLMAQEMLEKGKKVCLLNSSNWAKRDYTGGKSLQIFESMKNQGAKSFSRVRDLLDYLQNTMEG